jgi:hypothetical protein
VSGREEVEVARSDCSLRCAEREERRRPSDEDIDSRTPCEVMNEVIAHEQSFSRSPKAPKNRRRIAHALFQISGCAVVAYVIGVSATAIDIPLGVGARHLGPSALGGNSTSVFTWIRCDVPFVAAAREGGGWVRASIHLARGTSPPPWARVLSGFRGLSGVASWVAPEGRRDDALCGELWLEERGGWPFSTVSHTLHLRAPCVPRAAPARLAPAVREFPGQETDLSELAAI